MSKKLNRRRYQRKKISCDVYVGFYKPMLTKQEMKKAKLVDISLGGALFEYSEKLPKDKLVILDIELVGWHYFILKKYRNIEQAAKKLALRVNANVLRVNVCDGKKYLVAVQFVNMKAQDRDVLDEYIRQRREQSFDLF